MSRYYKSAVPLFKSYLPNSFKALDRIASSFNAAKILQIKHSDIDNPSYLDAFNTVRSMPLTKVAEAFRSAEPWGPRACYHVVLRDHANNAYIGLKKPDDKGNALHRLVQWKALSKCPFVGAFSYVAHPLAFYLIPESVRDLLQAGVSVDNVDALGRTPVHLAFEAVEDKANLDITEQGVCALICTALMLDNTHNYLLQDQQGWNFLHHAVLCQHESWVNLLLHKGIDPSVKAMNEFSALDLAHYKHNHRFIHLFGGQVEEKPLSFYADILVKLRWQMAPYW